MPMFRASRRLAAAVAALAVLGLGACSDDGEPEDSATETTVPSEGTTTTTGPAKAGVPTWDKPYQTTGKALTTITTDTFKVDVYQVGVAKATKEGFFVDPKTKKPLIAQGDDIVFVNYVITNTSNATILLPLNLVRVTAKYADWPYIQGMDGVADRALYEQMMVVDSALAPGNTKAPLAWEPGTTFSYGTNFKYQAGAAITFTASLTPADAQGTQLHDQRKEASQDTKIT